MERATVYSHRDVDDLLKNVLSELDENVIDQKLQHIDYFLFCITLLAFCFVLDKISEFVSRNYIHVTLSE